MTDIIVPTLGESVTEATVGQWLKAPGDPVKKDEVLVELETDKVAVEVSATESGTLSEVVAEAGDTVEIGAGSGPGRPPRRPPGLPVRSRSRSRPGALWMCRCPAWVKAYPREPCPASSRRWATL